LSAEGFDKAASSSSGDEKKKNYPPMTRDEVQAMLDTVPVYTVTQAEVDDGLVLLKEANNPNEIAYFFFSPQAAEKVFTPLKEKMAQETNWIISAYPLGLVWLELINDPTQQSQGIEYRLLSEDDNIVGAKNLLRKQLEQSPGSNTKIDQLFNQPYNQIPIFVNQFLGITAKSEDGETRDLVPMYVGLKDLLGACNQAALASKGDYEAAMSVIDLNDLVFEMTKKSGNPNDYRRCVLVPPTPPVDEAENAASTTNEAAEPDGSLNWKGKEVSFGDGSDDTNPTISLTTTNDWSD